MVESLKRLTDGVPLPGGGLLRGMVTQLRADWKWHMETGLSFGNFGIPKLAIVLKTIPAVAAVHGHN